MAQQYSDGDKVSLLWEDTLFAATVIKVHSNGAVDAAFKKDGSIAKNLTKAENILQLLGGDDWKKKEKEKPVAAKKRKPCSVDGCPNKAVVRGLCKKHSGREPCSVDGCATNAMARGLCRRHGAFGECKVEDCTSNARKKGSYCARHGGGYGFCGEAGCNTPCYPGTASGCKTNAKRGSKVCRKHSTNKVACSAEGCSNIARARGLCYTHAGHQKGCSTEGCGTAAKARGLCMKHGAFGFCSFGECTTAATSVAKGRCGRHSGGSRNVCKMQGCATLAYARGVCVKHGANGTCQYDGCTTSPRQGSQHCLKHGGKKNKPCSVAGCTTASLRKGLCQKHGGGPGECWINGCTNVMVSRLKTCATHGGKGYCSLQPKCWTPALKVGGNCQKHTNK